MNLTLRKFTALLAGVCGAIALTVAPAKAATNGVDDYSLAHYWAPVFMQDTDSSDYRADYITNFDYDRNMIGKDNWNNLNKYPLNAYIYYTIAETSTHYFITYAAFHPRDWTEWCFAPECHENDMEGVLVTIGKDGSYYGKFLAMVTVAHHHFYSYKDYNQWPSSAVSDSNENIDGDVQFYNYTHPIVYVEAKGHGIHGAKRWEWYGYPGGDGVTYIPGSWSEYPTSGNDRNVPYTLRNMREIWDRRYDNTYTFASYGTFRGDDYADNAANAPWGWDDSDDGPVYRGDLYMRPAYMMDYYHDGLGAWYDPYYVYSSDGAWRY